MVLFGKITVVLLCSVIIGTISEFAAASVSSPTPPTSMKQVLPVQLLGLPLQFEANHGQVDEKVEFLARGKGYTLFLTPTESVMVLQQTDITKQVTAHARHNPLTRAELSQMKRAVVRMKLEGANLAPGIKGLEPLPGIVNYFISNDPAKWRTNIPTYAKVQYQEVYPGIDLTYYGNQGTMEYDFIVAPGADPDQIRLAFEGASAMHLADSGDLFLTTDLGDVRVQKPVVYQLEPDGHKKLVVGKYIVEREAANVRSAGSASNSQSSVLRTQHSAFPHIGIQLADYDREKPLVIDPVLLYSSYLGGSAFEQGFGIAVDGSGQAYVTGLTSSANFPTLNASQPALEGPGDAFVTKLTANGALAYSTYLGGSEYEQGYGIAVDGSGQAYVTGVTASGDFPTLNPSQSVLGGIYDVFVTKLTANGALAFSTYLGGSDLEIGYGIAVDGSSQAYVTGVTQSGNFPMLKARQPALGGANDAFVTKLSTAVTNQPPVCSTARANPAVLWSPNQLFVPIAIMGVTDPDEDAVTITATGVTQDEPVNGTDDGNTSPDAVIQGRAASVRAERSGNGNGRVYQIAFTGDDGHGGTCTGVVTVGVPYSLKKGLTAIDDGQRYTSTGP